MFEKFVHHQPIADVLKCLIDSTRQGRATRRAQREAYAAIARFERAQWQPQVFKLASMEKPLRFDFDGEQLSCDPVDDFDPADAVIALLNDYQRILAQAVPRATDLFDIHEAAGFLGLSERQIKRHVYETGYLKGSTKAHKLLFTRAELEAFQALDLKPGPRPRHMVEE